MQSRSFYFVLEQGKYQQASGPSHSTDDRIVYNVEYDEFNLAVLSSSEAINARYDQAP